MAADQTTQTLIGAIVAGGITAIGWLAKRLYDAPRPADVDALRKDRDELHAIVLEATNKAMALAAERDEENRRLRDEISELRIDIERRLSDGDIHGLHGPSARRPIERRRQTGDSGDQTKAG